LTYRHTRPVFLCILSAVAAAAAIFLFKDLQFGQQSPTIQTKFRRLAHIIIYFLWGFFKNFLVAKKKKSLVTFDDFMENGKGHKPCVPPRFFRP
jgi:VanZ family protein